ncbi:hypothetical protein DRQ17_03095 [bacterium]|nr:MAG: hypothetical protein DRQ17_03095 [bacterium]RKZ21537.1 MAG: hypothetical protein DRQ23_06870 [bacterium]
MKKEQRKKEGAGKMARTVLLLLPLFMLGCTKGGAVDRIIGRTISFFSPRIQETTTVKPGVSPVQVAAQVQTADAGVIPDTILDTVSIDTVKDIMSALNWEKINYSTHGRQDPFKPLISKETIGQGLHPDQGELVGVIWGGQRGYLALVKEKGGSAFVLQEGDRVVNGYVEKIDRKSITFRMKQFGVTSKIVLHLKEGKEEGGK